MQTAVVVLMSKCIAIALLNKHDKLVILTYAFQRYRCLVLLLIWKTS